MTKPSIDKTWIIWFVLIIGICLHQIQTDHKRTVTAAYKNGALSWVAGEDIYGDNTAGFLYLPHSALLFIPFTVLPLSVGEITWRIMCIGLFAVAIKKLAEVACRRRAADMFLLVTVMTIPVALGAMRNGQMTLPMAATMIFAAVALADLKYSWAAFWLSIAVALKPLTLVMVVFAVVLYPALSWRVIGGLIAVFLIPFLFQSPAFVLESYLFFLNKLMIAGDIRESMNYSDIFGMLRAWGLTVHQTWMLILRALMGLGAISLAWYVRRKESDTTTAILLYVISITYLMLANPRTENNTYAAFAPALAVFAGWAFFANHRITLGWFFSGMMVFIALHHKLPRTITPGREVWLSPLVASVFAVFLLISVLKGPKLWKEKESSTHDL